MVGTGGITTTSDSLQILTSSTSINAGFSISFDAGTTFSSLSDQLNFQSLFGWSVSSSLSYVTFESQIQTNINTDALTVTGENSLNFNSAWGGITLSAVSNANIQATTINSDSLAGTNLVAGNNLNAASANTLNAFGGLADITSFSDSTITSPNSSVTFQAGGRIFANAGGNITFTSPNGTTITTNTPGADIQLISTGNSINFDSYYLNVDSYSTTLAATDSFSFQTVGLTFNVPGYLSFGDPIATQAFNFNSTRDTTYSAKSTLSLNSPVAATFSSAGNVQVNSGAEVKLSSGSIAFNTNSLTLNGADLGILGRHGSLISTSGSIGLTSQSFSVQAREIAIQSMTDMNTGNINVLSYESTFSHDASSITLSAQNALFSSANTVINCIDASLSASTVNFVASTLADFSQNSAKISASDIFISSLHEAEFLTHGSITFTVEEMLLTALQFLMLSNESISLTEESLQTQSNSLFINAAQTFTISSTNASFNSQGSIAFDAVSISITPTTLLDQTGETFTISAPSSAITFAQSQMNMISSGDTTFESLGSSSFSFSSVNIQGGALNYIAEAQMLLSATNITFNQTASITGQFSGDTTVNSLTSQINANTIAFSTTGGSNDEVFDIFAKGSGITVKDSTQVSVGQYGSIHQYSNSATLNGGGNINLVAAGSLEIDAFDGSLTFSIANQVQFSAGRDLNVESAILDDISITGTGITVNSSIATFFNLPNLSIKNSGSFSSLSQQFSLKGDSNGSTLSLVSSPSNGNLSAANRIVIAEDNLINYIVTSNVTINTLGSILVENSNSAWFQAGAIGISSQEVMLSSGGGASFNTTQNLMVNSAGSQAHSAAFSFDAYSATGGVSFFTSNGSILVESQGDIYAEARTGVTINSTAEIYGNPSSGFGNVSFDASTLLLVNSDNGGMVFRGNKPLNPVGFSTIVQNPTVSIVSEGSVVFDSPYNDIYATSLDSINLQANENFDVLSYINNATAVSDIDYNAPNGFLRISTVNSTLIQAGTNPISNAPFTIQASAGNLFLGTRNEFTFQSYGPSNSNGNGVTIAAAAGGIRFLTGIDTTFSSNAANSTFINSGLDFILNTTKAVSVYSQSSSVAISANTDVKFTVVGSPINFTTSIGTAGTDSFTATNGFIVSQSLYSIRETADNAINFLSNTGINFLVNDGRFDVSANQSTSNIILNAGGSLNFIAEGLYDTPEDGIYFGSSYNIKLQAANALNFNTLKTFTIGAVTLPTVVINAGGSPSQPGLTIEADGSIITTTQNTYGIDISGTFNVNAQTTVGVTSDGPASLTSIGTSGLGQNILLKASAGSVSIYGRTLDTESTTQITAQTFGQGLIRATGKLANSGLFVTAGDSINLVSTSGISTTSNILQASLTSSATLSATNTGSFNTAAVTGGDIVLTSGAAIVAQVSGDNGINFESDYNNSPIQFTTYKSNSPLSITSGGDSNIDISAGKRIFAAGQFVSMTSFEDVRIVSNNDLPTTMGLQGDILVAATASITETCSRDINFVGLQDVIYRTFGSQNGVGGPISFNSTDRVTIQTTINSLTTFQGSDFIDITNVPGFGGNIDFVAARNLQLIASFLNVTAAGNFQALATNDITYTLTSQGGFTATSGGALEIVAAGSSGSNSLGIVFEKSNNGLLTQTLISSNSGAYLNVFGATGVQFKWSTDPTNYLTTNIVTNKEFNVTSNGATATGNGILFQSNSISLNILGSLQTTALNTFIFGTNTFTINSGNTDANGVTGVRMESSGNTLFQSNSFLADYSGFYTVAPYVNFTSGQTLSLTTNADSCHVLIDSSGSVNITSLSSNSFYATGPTTFVTNGGILVNTTSSLTFNTVADISITALDTALNATVTSYASGSTSITANNIQLKSLSPLVESNINFLAEASRITIQTSGLSSFSDAISFVATSGDIDITCYNYGDFYVSPTGGGSIAVSASGGFSVTSTNVQQNLIGVLIQSSTNVAFTSNRNIYVQSQGTAEFNSNQAVTFSTIQTSGDDIPERLGDILLDFVGDISFYANEIFIKAERSLHVDASSAIQFESYAGPAHIDLGNSLFYIPAYTTTPTCVAGLFFARLNPSGSNPQSISLCGCIGNGGAPYCTSLNEFVD